MFRSVRQVAAPGAKSAVFNCILFVSILILLAEGADNDIYHVDLHVWAWAAFLSHDSVSDLCRTLCMLYVHLSVTCWNCIDMAEHIVKNLTLNGSLWDCSFLSIISIWLSPTEAPNTSAVWKMYYFSPLSRFIVDLLQDGDTDSIEC